MSVTAFATRQLFTGFAGKLLSSSVWFCCIICCGQGWQYGTVRYVDTVRFDPTFAKKYSMLVRYAFFVMVRVYGTLVQYAFLVMVPEVESRTQGSRPRLRPRTQKKSEAKAKAFRGQALSRPRTGMLEAKAKDTSASALQKKKKKGLHKNFSGDLNKKTFSKKFFKRTTKF